MQASGSITKVVGCGVSPVGLTADIKEFQEEAIIVRIAVSLTRQSSGANTWRSKFLAAGVLSAVMYGPPVAKPNTYFGSTFRFKLV